MGVDGVGDNLKFKAVGMSLVTEKIVGLKELQVVQSLSCRL